jgi:hypothetical protein
MVCKPPGPPEILATFRIKLLYLYFYIDNVKYSTDKVNLFRIGFGIMGKCEQNISGILDLESPY